MVAHAIAYLLAGLFTSFGLFVIFVGWYLDESVLKRKDLSVASVSSIGLGFIAVAWLVAYLGGI